MALTKFTLQLRGMEGSMSDLEFVVVALAAYRISQIVAQEVFFAPLRGWIVQNKTPEQLVGWRRWLGLLIHCAGCVSVWAGWGLAAIALLPLSGWLATMTWIAVYGLAASGVAVIVGEFLHVRR